MDLTQRDRRLIWHPFTQEKTADPPLPITRGKGSFVFDSENHKLLDLISSWWVNIHGHAHPEIVEAIIKQCSKLEHIIFAGFTHEPAILLCEGLCKVLPNQLKKYFFSDNGSTAVEVSLKMAFQYWKNNDFSQKTTFISLEGAYHGDTCGAMSVGLESGFHTIFSELCFPVKFIPFPETWIGDQEVVQKEQSSIEVLKSLLKNYSNEISALIVEPLIQGSSGMRMCRPEFIRQIVQMVRDHNILVIFDEVMTGFGRTGTYFALDQIDVTPDFVCLSKGLTGGFLPLSLTVTTDQVYETFLDNQFDKAFIHGHSYTANPIACAAALASLNILTRHETKEVMQSINRVHLKETSRLLKCSKVQRVRVRGTVAAFDLDETVDLNEIRKKCLQNGVLIRPLHRTVYFMPPYSTTVYDLTRAYRVVYLSIDETMVHEGEN